MLRARCSLFGLLLIALSPGFRVGWGGAALSGSAVSALDLTSADLQLTQSDNPWLTRVRCCIITALRLASIPASDGEATQVSSTLACC
jgi:hypothetical protein